MRYTPLATAGLILLLGAGCPLDYAKKVGFLERAHAKDVRQVLTGEPCAEGERNLTPAECMDAIEHLDVLDCQIVCLRVK